jgi:hypothetical protein
MMTTEQQNALKELQGAAEAFELLALTMAQETGGLAKTLEDIKAPAYAEAARRFRETQKNMDRHAEQIADLAKCFTEAGKDGL